MSATVLTVCDACVFTNGYKRSNHPGRLYYVQLTDRCEETLRRFKINNIHKFLPHDTLFANAIELPPAGIRQSIIIALQLKRTKKFIEIILSIESL